MIGWLIECIVNWLIDWLTDLPINWLIECLSKINLLLPQRRRGVISAQYNQVNILFNTTNKCLQPTLAKDEQWIEVCSSNDDACLQWNKTVFCAHEPTSTSKLKLPVGSITLKNRYVTGCPFKILHVWRCMRKTTSEWSVFILVRGFKTNIFTYSQIGT